MTLPKFAEQELKEFLASGKSGSITLNSDGQAIRQVEVRTIRREDHEDQTKVR